MTAGTIPATTAIVLCGGKGERLRPFTESLPKALVPLGGKPLLLYLLEHLHAYGIRDIVLCTGYLGEQVDAFVAGLTPVLRDTIRTSNAGEASILERIRRARLLAPGRCLIAYGDTLANVNLANLFACHAAAGVPATITIHPLRSPYGITAVNEKGLVTAFEEKPILKDYWINIGFLVLEPAVLPDLDVHPDFPEYLDALAASGRLNAYKHCGRHLTVNDPKQHDEANRAVHHLFNIESE